MFVRATTFAQSACVAGGGRATMETVRHQSPDWADEVKIRALILINAAGRKAA